MVNMEESNEMNIIHRNNNNGNHHVWRQTFSRHGEWRRMAKKTK